AKCGGGGMGLEGDRWSGLVVVRRNTLVGNGGSGIELSRLPSIYPTTIVVENNVGVDNGTWGFSLDGGGMVQRGCNDWFGNAVGAVNGVAADSTDLSVDPLFCNGDGADVRLNSASPLLGD